jgi:hypothetical protein
MENEKERHPEAKIYEGIADEAAIKCAKQRYDAAMHGMQTGVAIELEKSASAEVAGATPKHLRVGVNSAMVTDVAIANLLMAKGVFTKREYYEALADAAEAERDRYQERVHTWVPGVTLR